MYMYVPVFFSLQMRCSSVPAKMDAKVALMKEASSLVDCLPLEEWRVLQLRLDKLSLDWDLMDARLSERICKLKFEWSQTVSYHCTYVHLHTVYVTVSEKTRPLSQN